MHGAPLPDLQFAFANPALNGNTLLVPGQPGNIAIRVISVLLVMSGGVGVKFTGANSGDLSATFPVLANGGFVLPGNQYGWLQTAANEALNINLNSAVSGGVHISWIPVQLKG